MAGALAAEPREVLEAERLFVAECRYGSIQVQQLIVCESIKVIVAVTGREVKDRRIRIVWIGCSIRADPIDDD